MAISFTKTRLPFGWLGNMSSHAITHDGKEWRSAEALFQALRFDDLAIQESIRAEKSPMTAKITAKKNAEKMIVEPMSQKDLENMLLCLRLKVNQHTDLRAELLATGDEQLIEDVTNRANGRNMFWGMALQADGTWVGQNTLGNLWAIVRTELRA